MFNISSEIKKNIFIFGHCSATEELVEFLINNGHKVQAILDNNTSKQGMYYKGVEIVSPKRVLNTNSEETVVYIASKASEAMKKQLKQIGYAGSVENVWNCNSFSEYSLSINTIAKKTERLEIGKKKLSEVKEKYKNCFMVVCPYAALGDVYCAMAYLPYYLKEKKIIEYVVVTVGDSCSEVAKMFGCENVEAINQNDMDELVQAIMYLNDSQAIIAHHDRPYSSELIRSINVKRINFEELYCCGVYGLDKGVPEYIPTRQQVYTNMNCIEKDKTVIVSPYAKSVVGVSKETWNRIVSHYKNNGYMIYTNVIGEEEPIEGTLPISVSISMMQSVVEYAGVFIGVRSGLCDVIKNAKCRKIALFPDCYYSNTSMKVVDFFKLSGWENIVEGDLYDVFNTCC